MHRLTDFLLVAAVCGITPAIADDNAHLRYWPPAKRAEQARVETELNGVPSADSLRRAHGRYAAKPHSAGSKGDLALIEMLAAEYRELGLEVEKQELWLYLARPIDAAVELVSPHMKLDISEFPTGGDENPSPRISPGWNAYSGNGDVTAQVVYANYGTKEDFEKLRELGVDVAGKIVMARYGGNFRGYKAKYAQWAGAAGLIIYTDPADSGYVRGLMYPEGGYANPQYIQRGSILTLDYPGDPLTPGRPAVKDARRRNVDMVALPKIPVQPLGWGAANEILSRMMGPPVPQGWQGGLPFTYRLTGGDALTVRLMVNQKREQTLTYNVVGTLRGKTEPERKVIVGCHHDAWTYGASDPLAGTIVLNECARSFAKLAKQGWKPARSIVFANWAAEEFGLMGSVEWVETHRDDLAKNAVAYINLDMAAMGPNFGSSAAPLLKTLIADAARSVPSVLDEATSVFDEWLERNGDPLLPGRPSFGQLGGGSDHVGFYCHLAIPSAGLGAGGSSGTSYHSAYDHVKWYRQVVGDDYASALMLTRITNLVIARLADAPLVPLDPLRYATDLRRILDDLTQRAEAKKLSAGFKRIRDAVDDYEKRAGEIYQRLLKNIESGTVSQRSLDCANDVLIGLERAWLTPAGLTDRPWYRSLYAATDETSGYAAWMLPALRRAIEEKDLRDFLAAQGLYLQAVARLSESLSQLETCVE